MSVSTKTLRPQLKEMSSRQKGVMSDLDPVYSHGWRRKKYKILITSHSAWRMGYPKELEMVEI